MKSERILLPIDIERCPVEAFDFVNGLGQHCDLAINLLYVVTLDILAPENRVFDDLAKQAQRCLEELATRFVRSAVSIRSRVRLGKPAEQILAEAKIQKIDLIILPTFGPSFWDRFMALCKRAPSPAVSRLAQILIQQAPCSVLMLPSQNRLDSDELSGDR